MIDDGRERTTLRSSAHALTGVALLAAISAPASAIADPAPDYGDFGRGTFLTYSNAPPAGTPIAERPKLTMWFVPRQRYSAVMDTGSTAIVVSAEQVPSLEGTPCVRCLTYSSSGKIYTGIWVTLPVTIEGGNDATVTTAPIPVLAVTRVDCEEAARACTPEDHPSGVDMMGVGFGREYDGQPHGTPDANPFLNIADATGAPLRRGYVVTRTGVHVGLTRANTAGAFHFVKLQPNPTIGGEWQAPQGCTTVMGQAAPCGTVLVDTGVTSMFLTVPASTVAGRTTTGRHGVPELLSGTNLDFTFPGTDGGVEATYGFAVGASDDPLAPARVYLNTVRSPFVNTGVTFLNGFDVLYDADDGYFAFRARQDTSAAP